MRKRIIAQRTLFDHAIDLLVTMFKPSRNLKNISAVFDANPVIVKAVHADLTANGKRDQEWTSCPNTTYWCR